MTASRNDNATGAGGIGEAAQQEGQHPHSNPKSTQPGTVKFRVLCALRRGESLTAGDAWRRFGTSRLAAIKPASTQSSGAIGDAFYRALFGQKAVADE